MSLLFANPFNTSVNGFYFSSYQEYLIKSINLNKSSGQPVEEFEIEYIRGEYSQLFESCKIDQLTLSIWFDEIEFLSESDYIELYYRCAILGQYVKESLESLDTDGIIYNLSVVDYAYEYINDSGVLNTIPESLQIYFDYESLARDLEINGSVYEFHYNGSTYTASGF